MTSNTQRVAWMTGVTRSTPAGQPGSEKILSYRRCVSRSQKDVALASKPSIAPILTGSYRWYCWRCEPRTEYRVYMELHDQGLPVYLPHIIDYPSELNFVSVLRLAFPSYGFVALDSADNWLPSPGGSCVWRLMSEKFLTEAGDLIVRPSPLPPGAIARLQARGRPDDGVIDLRAKPPALPELAIGDPVRVLDGPFASHHGTISATDRDRVTALLSLFGRETSVTMARSAVQKM